MWDSILKEKIIESVPVNLKGNYYFSAYLKKINQFCSYFQIYLNFVNYVVNLAFPILTLCALNYKIYQELRKNLTAEVLLVRRNQNEQRENALRKRDIRLTRISIIIVVIFMICHIPRFIMNFIELAYGNLSKVRI